MMYKNPQINVWCIYIFGLKLLTDWVIQSKICNSLEGSDYYERLLELTQHWIREEPIYIKYIKFSNSIYSFKPILSDKSYMWI